VTLFVDDGQVKLRARSPQVQRRTAFVSLPCFKHFSYLLTDDAPHPFNGPLSGTTRVSRYQKGKTNLDFTEARDSEWQWHQLGRMQVCTSLQTDNHASTLPLCFLQAGCPSCRPTKSTEGNDDDAVFYN